MFVKTFEFRLTVEKAKPSSHKDFGWLTFTLNILKRIDENLKNFVVIMWGQFAQKQGSAFSRASCLKLKSAHPSPYSEDKFFGCKHFSQTNDYLKKQKKSFIDWKIPDQTTS